jgi:hypothetical protein
MWLLDPSDKRASGHATSDLFERIQRPEREQASLRAQLDSERQLRILAAQIVGAAQIAPVIGDAIEKFAQAMRASLPRGRAGGLARTRGARRYFDGTFMPESAKLEALVADYERYAADGRARAAEATRATDGTFMRTEGGFDEPPPLSRATDALGLRIAGYRLSRRKLPRQVGGQLLRLHYFATCVRGRRRGKDLRSIRDRKTLQQF